MRVLIKVDKKMIETGRRRRSISCALALAFHDVLALHYKVDFDALGVVVIRNRRNNGAIIALAGPPQVEVFLRSVYRKNEKPFKFRMEIPDKFLKPEERIKQ